MKTIKLDVAGYELQNEILVLYSKRTYRRAHALLAQNLVDTSVQAGSFISATAEASTYAQAQAAAADACRELGKLISLVQLMEGEKLYTALQTEPVLELSQAIKKTLANIVSGGVPETVDVPDGKRVKKSGEKKGKKSERRTKKSNGKKDEQRRTEWQKQQPVKEPKRKPKPAPAPAPAPKPVYDDDGFDDDVMVG